MISLCALAVVCLMYIGSSYGLRSHCGVTTAPHRDVDGVGVIATMNYEKGQVIERCLAFKLPEEATVGNVLDHYVYGHTEDNGVYYADIVLGHAMVYNHHQNASVEVIEQHKVPSPRQPPGVTDVYDFVVFAVEGIEAGQEMFSNYGGSRWFLDRNIPFVASPERRQADWVGYVSELPGCPLGLTDVYNGRVYAKQHILKGTTIEVSRGLIFKSTITAGYSVHDYVWHSPGGSGELVMLLLGNGALYRAIKADEIPNVDYDWYVHGGSGALVSPTTGDSTTHIDTIVACANKMFVKFIAISNILVNEELKISFLDNSAPPRTRTRVAKLPGDCF